MIWLHHVLHCMAHPHGWWWLVDALVLGPSMTLGIAIGTENGGRR